MRTDGGPLERERLLDRERSVERECRVLEQERGASKRPLEGDLLRSRFLSGDTGDLAR